MELRTIEDGILIGMWLTAESKGNVVLAQGLPQTIDKYHPIVRQMKDLGYNLFVPRYHGTYESKGRFSISNCKKTLERTIQLIRRGGCRELYGDAQVSWKNSPMYVLGYSFGALPSILNEVEVDKTVLICPFIDIQFHENGSAGEDIKL